jgi:SAM-dependent methyltransferase
MHVPSYSPAWFETFGRPEQTKTEQEVAFLLHFLPPPPASVLDVACGFGRHSQALSERGYRVLGVEREPAAVVEARRSGMDVVELDMRNLRELVGSFDVVICMWASFGWFDDATNADVLAQMAKKLRSEGVLVLDVYFPTFFRTRQGTLSIERNGRRVLERKRIPDERLYVSLEYEDGMRDEFEWRLYEPDELSNLGDACGLTCEALRADFDATARPDAKTARMQLVFRRM